MYEILYYNGFNLYKLGKIHGSLTRAGKVKNLTKFVEKKSKKINKKGRKKYRKLSSKIKNFIKILLQ